MQHQKSHTFLKDLYDFVRHYSGTFSQDAQRRAQAIQQSCDDLRHTGASDEKVVILEDLLQDIAEVVRGWPEHSRADDKKIAAGLLAFNFLLAPLIFTWAKPYTPPQIIALLAVIVNFVFNFIYLVMLYAQEKLNIESTGCLLSLVQFILAVGTSLVVTALLWYVLPGAVLVLLLTSLVALLVLSLYIFRGAIIAAHIRRVPPPQGNVQNSPTLSPTPKEQT